VYVGQFESVVLVIVGNRPVENVAAPGERLKVLAPCAQIATPPVDAVRISPVFAEDAVIAPGIRPVWATPLKLIAPVVGEINEMGLSRMLLNSELRS
jgi:hypothetical protein